MRPGGRFYLVHRPFRLAEIISCMVQYKLEPKRMRLVYPYVDKEPNMVLIEGSSWRKSSIDSRKTVNCIRGYEPIHRGSEADVL